MAKKVRANKALDRDLKSRTYFEGAAAEQKRQLLAPSLAFAFILISGLVVTAVLGWNAQSIIIIFAAAIGAYMALNIGANDVANNVGPAVGANAVTMLGALIIAAIFETAGALIAGGDVVGTISKGIIDPKLVSHPPTFIWAMFAALLERPTPIRPKPGTAINLGKGSRGFFAPFKRVF